MATHVKVHGRHVLIPTDTAVVLALVITELFTNAVKYAYGGRPGPIDVSLVESSSSLRVIVEDQGAGIAIEPSKVSFGSELVRGLIEQLEGEIKVAASTRGTSIVLSVPLTRNSSSSGQADETFSNASKLRRRSLTTEPRRSLISKLERVHCLPTATCLPGFMASMRLGSHGPKRHSLMQDFSAGGEKWISSEPICASMEWRMVTSAAWPCVTQPWPCEAPSRLGGQCTSSRVRRLEAPSSRAMSSAASV
jgi:Histidine kinase-like ATPase domain